jgi:hypothetical protein
MIDTQTRTEIARCMAKAIAYQNCGKPAQAQAWAARMVKAMECHGILTRDAIASAHVE